MTEPVGETKLENQYQAAWEEWYASEDAGLWDRITGDGLEPESKWPHLDKASPFWIRDS